MRVHCTIITLRFGSGSATRQQQQRLKRTIGTSETEITGADLPPSATVLITKQGLNIKTLDVAPFADGASNDSRIHVTCISIMCFDEYSEKNSDLCGFICFDNSLLKTYIGISMCIKDPKSSVFLNKARKLVVERETNQQLSN